MDAHDAYERLLQGNSRYLKAGANDADISSKRRASLAEGQSPYAVVVCCSDSRVVPEHVFCCGLGELFVVRTAGNTIGPGELASVLYACGHLGSKLVLVMGHTGCGAVAAALAGQTDGAVGFVTQRILAAADSVRDPRLAAELNVRSGLRALVEDPELAPLLSQGLELKGAIYDIQTGAVEFLTEG